MNYKMMGRFNALILAIEAAFMIPALCICILDGDADGTKAFLLSIAITLAVAGLLALISIGARRDFYAREGLVCVGGSWIVMSLLGCLPFVFSGQIPRFIDALFEIVSGFTTTGSSIVPDLEKLTRGIIYWRSFSHWLGGMGVLVFLLAIVPVSGRNEGFTMHLLRAESPGPDVGKLVPKMRRTAAILYITYIALTVLNIIFYLVGGMPAFEAVCNAFGTAGTGGFGIKNDSFAGYSPYLQVVSAVFMFLFGINFSCYYLLLIRDFKSVFRDEELRFYVCTVVGSIIMITLNIRKLYPTVGEAIRHAAFQVSSIITTTGFASTDFDLWPTFSKAVLFCLMIVGACAGSTGGGMKCARVLLLLKGIRRNLEQILHPRRVQSVRINDKPVDEKLIANTNAYLATYAAIIIASFLIVAIDSFEGYTLMSGLSAVVACFNNIGPGFEAVGPTCNFSSLSVLSKLVLIFDMLAGRLEIFPILVLFNPSAWKRR